MDQNILAEMDLLQNHFEAQHVNKILTLYQRGEYNVILF